jgi:hypothetical protein
MPYRTPARPPAIEHRLSVNRARAKAIVLGAVAAYAFVYGAVMVAAGRPLVVQALVSSALLLLWFAVITINPPVDCFLLEGGRLGFRIGRGPMYTSAVDDVPVLAVGARRPWTVANLLRGDDVPARVWFTPEGLARVPKLAARIEEARGG